MDSVWMGEVRTVVAFSPGSLLHRIFVRPAAIAIGSALVLILAANQLATWPFAMVGGASLLGLWEGYSGVVIMLRVPAFKRLPGAQLQLCLAWLIVVLANLALLNGSTQMAHPATFEWRGTSASVLDVIYFTCLTFGSGGFGDVLPATPLGKVLAMLTNFAGLGYATICLTAIWQHFTADERR